MFEDTEIDRLNDNEILENDTLTDDEKYEAWRKIPKNVTIINTLGIVDENIKDKFARKLWNERIKDLNLLKNSKTNVVFNEDNKSQFTTCKAITINFTSLNPSKNYESEIKGRYINIGKTDLYHNYGSKLYLYVDNIDNYYILKIRHDRSRNYLQMVALTMNGNMYIARHKSVFKRTRDAMGLTSAGHMGMETARAASRKIGHAGQAISRELYETFGNIDVHDDMNAGDAGGGFSSHSIKPGPAMLGGNTKVNNDTDIELKQKINEIIEKVENDIYKVAKIKQSFNKTTVFKNMNKFREYNFRMNNNDKTNCTITITLSEKTQGGGKLNRRTMRRHKKTHRKKQSHHRKTK